MDQQTSATMKVHHEFALCEKQPNS